MYDIAALRQDIFILEQTCLYRDLDGVDLTCKHLLLYTESDAGGGEAKQLVGYLRIVPPNTNQSEISLGRLVVREGVRGKGYAKLLINTGIEGAKNLRPSTSANQGTDGDSRKVPDITLSGQTYLKRFYEERGFVAEGDVYEEDGIPHQRFRYVTSDTP